MTKNNLLFESLKKYGLVQNVGGSRIAPCGNRPRNMRLCSFFWYIAYSDIHKTKYSVSENDQSGWKLKQKLLGKELMTI